ncbi:hypothetical protein D9615_010138 [Tricholomella constricta]|uniref:Small RNA 2'-O-methyltransferase n=1 Tax=Tricholomella constricta TaxID=117010 RepID=A0A8H5GXJ8_9AGAR|nr:hypothetical protein D9615_010138 [Tricholomella constricta]
MVSCAPAHFLSGSPVITGPLLFPLFTFCLSLVPRLTSSNLLILTSYINSSYRSPARRLALFFVCSLFLRRLRFVATAILAPHQSIYLGDRFGGPPVPAIPRPCPPTLGPCFLCPCPPLKQLTQRSANNYAKCCNNSSNKYYVMTLVKIRSRTCTRTPRGMGSLSKLTALESVQDKHTEELKVTFYPPLFLQRRIWILDVLRTENVTKLLDVGCGEGQLLSVLCQPVPWLAPPPPHVLPPIKENPNSSDPTPASPTYNDEIPNIHPTHIMGLDICASSLEFTLQGTAPPQAEVNLYEGCKVYASCFTNVGLRWEDLEAKIWKGGLEVINEEFVDVECIVSTEVIEHLPPDIFPAFAPVLLGVYHPRLFLVTTPSYTFSARFTAPRAPPTARRGYPDPTKRTDRVFRHSDHKFEWMADEFRDWCDTAALEWGYDVQVSTVGRAVEVDEWGRDAELGGATSVAIFRRRDLKNREEKGRAALRALRLNTEPHKLLANHKHFAHPSSEKPKPLEEIGLGVKAKMEEFREGFMRIEDLWFEREIAVLCGGWIEVLVRAVEICEFLVLKRDGEEKGKRGNWVVELVGGITEPKNMWPTEGETSIDHIPVDWIPGEEPESSEEDWAGSTDMEGDVSWNDSEGEDDMEERGTIGWSRDGWGTMDEKDIEATGNAGWGAGGWTQGYLPDIPNTGDISTAGWDGDESDKTT